MLIREPRRALSAIAAQPWAIEEGKGAQIWEMLELRSRGEKRPDEELQAAIRGRRDKMLGQSGGIMVIPIFGVLSHRMDAFEEASGGTSVEKLGARIQQALASEDIGTIVLQVDSPGGSVYGIAELAQKIFEARGSKKIVAVADPLMASAAYWIASAADEVVVTPSGQVGSIGVISVHAEFSRLHEAAGITVEVIRSGKYKAESNPYEPLTDEAKAALQRTADDYYALFTGAVARHRKTTPDAVAEGYGQARVLTAERAVQEGLADRVATFEQVLSDLGVKPATLSGARADAEAVPVQDLAPAAADGFHVVSLDALLRARLRHAGIGDRPPSLVHPDGRSTQDSDAPPAAEAEEAGPADTEDPPGADADAPDDTGTPAHPTAPRGQEDTMAPKNGTGPQDGAEKNDGGTAAADVQVTTDREAASTQRASQIADLCAAVGIGHRAGELIESGLSIEQVREKVRGEAEQGLRAMTAPAVDMSEREVKRYSLTRAIMNHAEKGEGWDGFEREVSDQIRKNLPENYKPRGGIFVPVRRAAHATDHIGQRSLLVNRLEAMVREQALPLVAKARLLSQIDQMKAALDSGTSGAGQEVVFTEAGDFIDLLRARMKVAQLGATILTGLQGPVSFPKQSAAGSFSWVAEDPGSDLSDSDLTLTQVALNPKTGQSTTAYSRQLLAQGVIDVDNLVKNDLALITALGIDLAAINGSGASNQPTGVLNTSGIGSVAGGTNGLAPTYAHMVDLETEVATDNADIGAMAYLTTPGIRGKLKKTEEFSSSNGRPVWTGGMDGEANGYPAHVSTQVPSNLTKGTSSGVCHAIIFGVWSQLMLGYWGAYELVVDPYTKKKQGLIELTSFQMAGIAVRHPESFAAMKDALTS